MLEIGSKAPLFTLKNQKGEEVSLSDYLGKKVILYFYPKDNTSGCTLQALQFKKQFEELPANVVVLGISKDSVSSHDKFACKYELPFTILADEDHSVIEAYDCWKEKSLYGRKYMGTMRNVYVIDEQGIIVGAYEKVKTTNDILTYIK